MWRVQCFIRGWPTHGCGGDRTSEFQLSNVSGLFPQTSLLGHLDSKQPNKQLLVERREQKHTIHPWFTPNHLNFTKSTWIA